MAIANYSKVCAKNVPGMSTLWVVESTSITSVTIVAGEVTAMVMVTSATFKTIAIDQDTFERTEEGKGSKTGNIGYKHTIKFNLSSLGTPMNVLRGALEDASICGITALVKDNNGIWWLVGYNGSAAVTAGTSGFTDRPLRLMQNNAKSGLTPNDDNAANSEITLECENGYMALPVKSTSTVAVGGITAAI